MRKQELVHLHVLCWEVRSHLEDEHDVSDSAFERYDRFGVPPTAIYRSKETHKEALGHLLDDIDAALEDEQAVTLGHAATD